MKPEGRSMNAVERKVDPRTSVREVSDSLKQVEIDLLKVLYARSHAQQGMLLEARAFICQANRPDKTPWGALNAENKRHGDPCPFVSHSPASSSPRTEG